MSLDLTQAQRASVVEVEADSLVTSGQPSDGRQERTTMSKENGHLSAGKLLVVDDDSNLIELVAMKLKGANYEVATALKEEDALKAATDGVFDLCIVDFKLADRNGISLMTELHSVNPEM